MNELAELIRRNPVYVKKARQFKEKWDYHFKAFPCEKRRPTINDIPLNERENLWCFNPIRKRFEADIRLNHNLPILDYPKGEANPIHEIHPQAKWVFVGHSEKLKNFLESWNLTRFLDPDNSKDGTFNGDLIANPNQLIVISGGILKPKNDRLYIEIRRGMKVSTVRRQIDELLNFNFLQLDVTDTRKKADLKKQLKIYDLRVADKLSFSQIAKKVYRHISLDSKARKSFNEIEKRIKNVKRELP